MASAPATAPAAVLHRGLGSRVEYVLRRCTHLCSLDLSAALNRHKRCAQVLDELPGPRRAAFGHNAGRKNLNTSAVAPATWGGDVLRMADGRFHMYVSELTDGVSGTIALVLPINPNQSQSIPINPNRSQSIPIDPNRSQSIPIDPYDFGFSTQCLRFQCRPVVRPQLMGQQLPDCARGGQRPSGPIQTRSWLRDGAAVD
eukprot:SAG31_NODE_1073_length_10065_cov_2.176701_3_plen_200_part_00